MRKTAPGGRITFTKDERAKALKLSIAASEANDARSTFIDGVLTRRGADLAAEGWQYDPMSGVARRIK